MSDVDSPIETRPPRTARGGVTRRRLIALTVIAVLGIGLLVLSLGGESEMSVPEGAVAGDLILDPCTYDTEDGVLAAECGTLVVPENRADSASRFSPYRSPSFSCSPGSCSTVFSDGASCSNIWMARK